MPSGLIICLTMVHWYARLSAGYREPLLYNVSVVREFLKQVYVAERLQPPTSFTTVSNAYSAIWARVRNPAYFREIVQSGEWAKVGVYAVEAYGIFKVCPTRAFRYLHAPVLFRLLTFSFHTDWGDHWEAESCRLQRSVMAQPSVPVRLPRNT